MPKRSSTKDADTYRPDIDGLRAVAVMAVVLFHAGMRSVSGGYVGVDVFFVISGYLITRYINQRVAADRFSIGEFYERRIRRIIPALFFLLLSAGAIGYITLLPGDLVSFAKSAIAALFFVPNLLFYRGAGYFATGTNLQPLLHLWSLGVEEQFYILFPLFMVLISRWGRRGTLISIYFAFGVSFAASIWSVQYAGSTQPAFYLVPFRAWELLTGALLALRAFPPCKSVRLRNFLAAIGLAAVLLSVFRFSLETPFPGLTAAVPCFGTALVIYANESGLTLTGSLLSLKPIVGIGLLSYSLYLWHWPFIVFARLFRNRPLTATESTACVLLSFAAAALSWKFVEQPFRKGSFRGSRRILFLRVATVAAGLTIFAGVCIKYGGFRQRFPRQALVYLNDTSRDTHFDTCRTVTQVENQQQCHLGSAQHTAPSFLVWGDSHAAALAPAFDTAAKDNGETGWIASRPACMPLLGVERVDAAGCADFNADIVKMIERHNIRLIALVGRWSIATQGLSPGELEEGRPQALLFDPSTRMQSAEESSRLLERGLRRLLSDPILLGRVVLFVFDLPDTGVNTPRHLAWSVIRGAVGPAAQDITISMSPYSKQSIQVDALLRQVAREYHVLTIDPKSELCKGSECLIAHNGHSLYRDSHHLTMFGAEQLVPLVETVMSDTR